MCIFLSSYSFSYSDQKEHSSLFDSFILFKLLLMCPSSACHPHYLPKLSKMIQKNAASQILAWSSTCFLKGKKDEGAASGWSAKFYPSFFYIHNLAMNQAAD